MHFHGAEAVCSLLVANEKYRLFAHRLWTINDHHPSFEVLGDVEGAAAYSQIDAEHISEHSDWLYHQLPNPSKIASLTRADENQIAL